MIRHLNTIIFIAIWAISTGAMGQKVYRCGAEYSQTPCENGVMVNAEDPRTSTQKAASDAATHRDTAVANAMEKARLKEEAKARKTKEHQTSMPHTKKSTSAEGDKTTPTEKRSDTKKKKEPEFFTARIAPVKTKPGSTK